MKSKIMAMIFVFLLVACSSTYSREPSPIAPLPSSAFSPVIVNTYASPDIRLTVRDFADPTPHPTIKPKPKVTPKPTPKPIRISRPRAGTTTGSVIRATATYCGPKYKNGRWYCKNWNHAYVGAVSGFTWGDKQYRVQVCLQGTHRCTIVTVVSFCACNDKKGIDLSIPAFKELAPLWKGRIKVTIQKVK